MTPNGMPIAVAMISERKMSSRVIGSAFRRMSDTGSAFRSESPKSPWSAFPIHVKYCSTYEPVRPSCSRAASRCSGVVVMSPPMSTSRMSPGSIRTMRKITIEMTISVGIA